MKHDVFGRVWFILATFFDFGRHFGRTILDFGRHFGRTLWDFGRTLWDFGRHFGRTILDFGRHFGGQFGRRFGRTTWATLWADNLCGKHLGRSFWATLLCDIVAICACFPNRDNSKNLFFFGGLFGHDVSIKARVYVIDSNS